MGIEFQGTLQSLSEIDAISTFHPDSLSKA